MKWKFSELQGRVQAATGHRITYEEITEATGLANQTISSLSTGKAKRLDLRTVGTLLTFFSQRLGEPLTTNDLLEYQTPFDWSAWFAEGEPLTTNDLLEYHPADPPRITTRPEFHIDTDEG